MLSQTSSQTGIAAPDPLNRRADHAPSLGLVWAILRVPLLLGLLFLFRNSILAIDPERITLFVIELASTPAAHVLAFLAFFALFGIVCFAARRLGVSYGYVAAVVAIAAITMILFHLLGTQRRLMILVVVVAATNLMPDALYERLLVSRRLRDGFMNVAVGFSEFFFFRRYLVWTLGFVPVWQNARSSTLLAVIPGVAFSAATAALCIGASALTPLEQALRMSPAAHILAHGDTNWIELDASGQYLFVTGHGLPRLRRLDVAGSAGDAKEASVDTGGAQGFAYDPAAGEIYVYNTETHDLLYLDATTLQQKRSIALPELSSGDPWIAVDAKTNTLTIASEADSEAGTPFLVVNRSTGKVVDRRQFEAGNLLLRPDTSRLYLSFFRRSHKLLAYDLRTLSVVDEVPVPQHVDRMAYVAKKNEILLASPAQSRIERFDATSLASKGNLKSIFGVRVLAIDRAHDMLFAGSFATGELSVTDLVTGRELGRFYLGPWLRTIQVDAARSIAYVSSNGAVYSLHYDKLQ
jgi:hypothetical protein